MAYDMLLRHVCVAFAFV